MRVPSYLSRSRHGIYYFRLHVPEYLRESVGNRTNIRQSLRTRNAQEASIYPTPSTSKASGVTFPQAIAAFIESTTEVKPRQRTAKKVGTQLLQQGA